MHQHYSENISNCLNEVIQISTQKDESDAKVKEYEQLLQEFKRKEEEKENFISLLKQRYKVLKSELLKYREEYRILKIKYENLVPEDFKQAQKLFLIPKRFKRRATIELNNKLAEDPIINMKGFDDKKLPKEIFFFGK